MFGWSSHNWNLFPLNVMMVIMKVLLAVDDHLLVNQNQIINLLLIGFEVILNIYTSDSI